MWFRNWWYRHDGRSKAITALAVLLLLQIGLCFSSPGVAPWFGRTFHITSLDDPMQTLLLMFWQERLCVLTACLLIAVAMGFPFLTHSGKKRGKSDR